MRRLRTRHTTALALIAAGCALACASPQSGPMPDPVWTTEGMYRVPGSRTGAMFVQHPIPDFSHYTGIMLEEVRIRPAPRLKLKQQEIAWLERFARKVLLRRLSRQQGWQVVDAPGPNVLKARVAILDIEFRRSIFWETTLQFLYPSGRAAMIVDLRDSLQNQRLWIYTQSRRLPLSVTPSRYAQIERVGTAFSRFARSAMRYLDVAIRGEVAEPIGPAPDHALRNPSG